MVDKRIVVIETPWNCPWNMTDLETEALTCAKVEPRRVCLHTLIRDLGFPPWCPLPDAKAEYWWCIKEDDNLMTASARSHPDVVRQDAGYGDRLPKHAKIVRIRVEEVGDDD